MYYYLDTVLRLWHFTGAEREAREFRRKLVYKTGFCMRYLELGLPPGAVGALAENYALSECDRLVPTRRSSFFRLAAVRSKRPHVRAVWACPATELQARVMASSGSTVESCNVMAQCPAPGGRYTY